MEASTASTLPRAMTDLFGHIGGLGRTKADVPPAGQRDPIGLPRAPQQAREAPEHRANQVARGRHRGLPQPFR